jgi:deoxyribodipyrimidine photo-lyase
MYNSIFIFRRDFRIIDNKGLNECIKNSKKIYPIFIFTPTQINKNEYKSSNSIQFLIESLKELLKDINLNIFYGDNDNVIIDIINNNKIDAIYTNVDYTPFSIKRDNNLKKNCENKNIKLFLNDDICLYKPRSIKTKTNNIYKKFTPYYNECLKHNVDKPIKLKIKKTYNLKSKYKIKINYINKFYTYNKFNKIIGGRNNAMKILNNIEKFNLYENTKNNLNIETTNLSSYIKYGCISIREVYHKILKLFGKKHSLIRQLIWRDFYINVFIEYLNNLEIGMNYKNIKWSNNKNYFIKWKNGNTGFPIVDACIRCLNKTGYLHNRGRLIVSSFLVKNLQYNWVDGAKYFATKLIDYDPIINQGNWLWVSSLGTDSQPYFRIFNPWNQGKKYDKNCIFIKKWLPELINVDNKDIHKWDISFKKYPNIKYSQPIIDYKKSKEKTIKLFKFY